MLQHRWAEISEQSSDVLDPTRKYGGGPAPWRNILSAGAELVGSHEGIYSRAIALDEESVASLKELEKTLAELHLQSSLQDVEDMQLKIRGYLEESGRRSEELREKMVSVGNRLAATLGLAISALGERRLKGQDK